MTREVLKIPIGDVIPSVSAVLERQGVPRWKQPNGKTAQLAHDAVGLFMEKASPRGLAMEITAEEFTAVFDGEGRNETDSPVGSIYQAAANLALFAVTSSQDVCSEIQRLFKANDFALGSMLDSVASEGTELTAQAVEDFYRQQLKDSGNQHARNGILRFSPGYCGWHISAQRKLFEILRPGEIGITLNESCLMQPLKSISGVIISGDKDIFCFDDTFSFCRDCAEHTCRDRIRSVMNQ